ncbi:lysylphosphatidylglycerol synthase transmembrane domain-containing protein [Thermodesulfobacteriota bacterium]
MNKVKDKNRSINWKLWSGLLISALFLYLAFRKVDLTRIWEVIRATDLPPLALVVLITLFQFVIRAWRWRILLESIKKTGFSNRLLSIFIGFAGNCILPARLGEFIRANYLGHAENISRSSTFGTIVVERFFDGFTLLFFLLIGIMGTTFPEELHAVSGSLRTMGLLFFLLYILIIVFLVGFKYKTNLVLGLLDRLLFFFSQNLRSRVVDIIRNFSLGIVPLKNTCHWIQAIFYSLLLWFSSLYQIQLIGYSIGLSLPFITTFLIMAMASFGVAIPSAPGFIGTFHLAVQYGFLFYGVPREEALSAAIIWHAALFFPTVFFGFISFLFLQTSYSSLSEESHILKKELERS